MSWIIDWDAADFETQPVGGKARALGSLSAAGLPIPQWSVLPAIAFEASLSADQKVSLSKLSSAVDALEILKNLIPNEEIVSALFEHLDHHFANVTQFAVRSSALDEDGVKASFAGQLESHLNVPRDEIAQRIADVWRSGFSERIFLYREQAGLPNPPPAPAVILQAMIPAESAGVAFSADPVTGRRGVAIVASVFGLGEALVSGEKNSDTFEVDRHGKLIHKNLVSCDAASLTDAQAVALAALARRCAKHFERPQDIEWALADGKLHLLQSRPITSLHDLADPDGAFYLWDNSNIAESYSGVTTPLTFSFALKVYEEVYVQFVKILHVPNHRIEAHRDTFAHMLGMVRGQIYYNLLSWYRVLALLPGFAVNRRFMEQMMGVKEGLPESVLAEFKSTQKAGWRDYAEIAETLGGLVWSHLSLPNKKAAFYQRLDEALRPGNVAMEDLRPDELAAAYRRLQNQLLTRWDAPLINDFFAMIYYGLLRKLVTSWCGDEEGTLQNDLISGQGGMISAEPARRVQELAQIARENLGLPKLLQTAPWVTLENELPKFPKFFERYQSYLQKFGDRCLEELKLESATLHDDPLLLLRSIGQLAAQPARTQPELAISPTQAAEIRVAEKLANHPIRRILFSWILNQARERVRDRENLRFERTRVFGQVRRIFVELGRRLYGLNVLTKPRDVFYLAAEETLGYVEGTSLTMDLNALAQLRKAEFASYHQTEVADRFETRGVVYAGNSFGARQAASPPPAGDHLKGIGCCPGIVRGKARVILDPRNAVIHPGEILVAPRTDPGWIMLFPAAAGLLVEHGSLLSHSAIVAREMRIPAVVSLAGVTAWLKTGDEVELDGSSGVVTLIQPHEK